MIQRSELIPLHYKDVTVHVTKKEILVQYFEPFREVQFKQSTIFEHLNCITKLATMSRKVKFWILRSLEKRESKSNNMKTTVYLIGAFLLINAFGVRAQESTYQNSEVQQRNQESSKAGAQIASKVTSNDNPLPVTEELPADFPAIHFDGNPEQNFFDYIKAKAVWFNNNPDYLERRFGLTRVSQQYIDSLSKEVQEFIENNRDQFEILDK